MLGSADEPEGLDGSSYWGGASSECTAQGNESLVCCVACNGEVGDAVDVAAAAGTGAVLMGVAASRSVLLVVGARPEVSISCIKGATWPERRPSRLLMPSENRIVKMIKAGQMQNKRSRISIMA
mgnify:CR=1 FL=1